VALLGRLIGALERRLNRARRSPATLRARGALLVAAIVGAAAFVGWAIGAAAGDVPMGWLLEAVFVAVLLAGRGLFDHVRRVARALRMGGVEAGRAAVAHVVGRDVAALDRHGVARAAIESTAENFADGLVAPAFWYVVLGPAGIAAYKAVNTLDSMVGYRDERFRDFGFAAARLDDLANWIPSRLAAGILCLAAAFVPSASPLRAGRTAIRDARRHASPNAGWPEAAMAGALDLALNGPRTYGGIAGDQPWLGSGRARAEPADIDRALFMLAVAWALLTIAAAGLALLD
jgi:adenosylcobinamide-phosphate synthase